MRSRRNFVISQHRLADVNNIAAALDITPVPQTGLRLITIIYSGWLVHFKVLVVAQLT
jgi:hypothetical protein